MKIFSQRRAIIFTRTCNPANAVPMADDKTPTHTAFTLKREGKRHSKWLESGTGRHDSNGVFHAFLDRLPVGGFNGYVYFAPVGETPPDPEPARPPQPSDEEEDLG
jgi:hypothetical protein